MKKALSSVFLSIGITACLLGMTLPASATIVEVTATGTVSSGTDANGYFGAVGASLAGDSYTAQYSFDTSLGTTGSGPPQTYAYGGTRYSDSSPSLGASLTINGHVYDLAGAFYGYIATASNTSYFESSDSSASSLVNEMYGSEVGPYNFDMPFVLNSDGGDGSFTAGSTSLYLSTSEISVAVPEPVSITMLGFGVAMIGFMGRRRRKVAARGLA